MYWKGSTLTPPHLAKRVRPPDSPPITTPNHTPPAVNANQGQANTSAIGADKADPIHAPNFARSSLGGKRNSKVEARVTDDMKADLEQRCHALGMSTSDYIERLLAVSLYGIDHVLTVERERTAKVCGLSGLDQRGVPA